MPRNSAPHFKVLCSIQNHEKIEGLFEDHDAFAIWVKLGLLAVERYADRTGDRFKVTVHDVRRITQRSRADHAWNALIRVADLSRIEVDPSTISEGYAFVIWRNFAKKQFPRREDGTRREGSASASATATTKEPPLIPPAGGTRPRRKGRTCAPEALSVEQLRALQAWAANHEDPEIRRRQMHVPELAQACLDHFRSKGQQRVDWLATVRNWVRNQRNFDKGDSRGGAQKQSIGDAVRRVIEDDLSRRRSPTH